MTSEEFLHNEPGAEYAMFAISEEQAEKIGAALPVMIAGRLGYMDRMGLEESPKPDDDIAPYIELIVSSSSHDADYLLPDTPLKEAIFRIILANGNEPMDARQISEILSERWAMSAFPRRLEPPVIDRLLKNSGNYCIVEVAETEV